MHSLKNSFPIDILEIQTQWLSTLIICILKTKTKNSPDLIFWVNPMRCSTHISSWHATHGYKRSDIHQNPIKAEKPMNSYLEVNNGGRGSSGGQGNGGDATDEITKLLSHLDATIASKGPQQTVHQVLSQVALQLVLLCDWKGKGITLPDSVGLVRPN